MRGERGKKMQNSKEVHRGAKDLFFFFVNNLDIEVIQTEHLWADYAC